MSLNEYSRTILTVRARNRTASEAFHLPHNSHRLVSSHFSDRVDSLRNDPETTSRETTPYIPRNPQHELRLEFHPRPKDPTRGFVFGSDEKVCDILLGENKKGGISGIHFYIDFNWGSGLLRLNNVSKHGTTMRAYSTGDVPLLLKANTMQMLHPAEETDICVGNLELTLSIPNRGEQQAEYDNNWRVFRDECQHVPPALGNLGLHSSVSTQPAILRKGLKSTYLLYDVIGRGEFGTVYRAGDHLSGDVYAAKQFTTNRAGWNKSALTEIAIYRKVSHNHIVRFIDVLEDSNDLALVMEYMSLGNLREQDELRRISVEETKTFLSQVLHALMYLHDQNITHRDLKPENILVQSRMPDLIIKISDFGLAKQAVLLETLCGTLTYIAPEIFSGVYTNSVDIWALGVIGYEFTAGLPRSPKIKDGQDWSKAWTAKLQRAFHQSYRRERDPMTQALKKMLELDSGNRPSAKECLSEPFFQNTPQSLQADKTLDNLPTTEAISTKTTIIWDPLWQIEDTLESRDQNAVLKGTQKRLRSFSPSPPVPQGTGSVSRKIENTGNFGRNLSSLSVEELCAFDRQDQKTKTKRPRAESRLKTS